MSSLTRAWHGAYESGVVEMLSELLELLGVLVATQANGQNARLPRHSAALVFYAENQSLHPRRAPWPWALNKQSVRSSLRRQAFTISDAYSID